MSSDPIDDDRDRVSLEEDFLRHATVLLDDQEVFVVPVDQGEDFLTPREARERAWRYGIDGEGLTTRTRDR